MGDLFGKDSDECCYFALVNWLFFIFRWFGVVFLQTSLFLVKHNFILLDEAVFARVHSDKHVVCLLVSDVKFHFLCAKEFDEATELLLIEISFVKSIEQVEDVKELFVDRSFSKLLLNANNKLVQIIDIAVQFRNVKTGVELLSRLT